LNAQIIRIWAARTAELIGRVQAQIGASPSSPDPARFRGGMSRYSSLVTGNRRARTGR
jgi:hypothetical protein